jgi:hypothetical protein
MIVGEISLDSYRQFKSLTTALGFPAAIYFKF